MSISVLALAMPGMMEWLIIGLVGLLLFGKRLPMAGRGLGEGIRNFKLGLKEGADEAEPTDVNLRR